jgi:hypothetical protein
MTVTGFAAPPFALAPMPKQEITVQYCDNNLNPLGQIQWATVTATLNYNSVGSWSILAPFNEDLWEVVIGGGDFIVLVNWRGLFTFGGKCETPTYQSAVPGATSSNVQTAGSFNGGEFITLAGADFMQVVANRLAYPDPTKVWQSQLQGNGDIVGGIPLETAIKYYVNRNVGTTTIPTHGGNPSTIPPAIPSRQHPLVTVAADQGRGPAVYYQVNFGLGTDLNLLTVVRALITQAYPNYNPGQSLGFEVNLVGNKLVFDCYVPQNKTNVSFSEQQGNLTSILFSLTDPTCTNALVRGTAVNQFKEVAGNNVTPWTRIETFQDGQTDDTNKILTTLANNMLSDGTFGPILNATVADTPDCIFGRDYYIGDMVTIEVKPGVSYTDIVSSVTLTADPSSQPILDVVPIIGNSTDPTNSSTSINKQMVAQIKQLNKRIAQLGG